MIPQSSQFSLLDQINSAVGNNSDKEKKLALALLHGAIGAKKKGAVWTKAYEQLMKRHLELCVDLKDHRMAKDGLHQYRNLCQSVRKRELANKGVENKLSFDVKCSHTSVLLLIILSGGS